MDSQCQHGICLRFCQSILSAVLRRCCESLLLLRKSPTNTQHQNAIGSPVGFAGHGFRVVADEGDNFEPRLRANRIAIVLPSLHSLICYAKHLSHLDLGQIPVNTCQPEMFAKRPRMRWNCFLSPPIHRNHWQTCFNRPTTNTQQCALISGRFYSAHLAIPAHYDNERTIMHGHRQLGKGFRS